MNNRGLTIALIISLVVNVFIIGSIAGAIGMRQRMIDQRTRPPAGNPLMRVSERLPEDVRARYMSRMRAEGTANRSKMAEARQARADAAKAMMADPYDPKAAGDALARARIAEEAMRASLESAVVDIAKDLTPDQRRVIAQGLRSPGGPGGPGGRRGRGPGGRGPDGRGPDGRGMDGRGFDGRGSDERGFGPPPGFERPMGPPAVPKG